MLVFKKPSLARRDCYKAPRRAVIFASTKHEAVLRT